MYLSQYLISLQCLPHHTEYLVGMHAVSYTPGVHNNFKACVTLVKKMLDRNLRCAPPNSIQNKQCSFNGVWQGDRGGINKRNYVLLSSFWYKVDLF